MEPVELLYLYLIGGVAVVGALVCAWLFSREARAKRRIRKRRIRRAPRVPHVTVPAGTPSGTVISITVTATSLNDSNITNSATLALAVMANQPPDCSGVADLLLWPPNHQLVAIDLEQVGIVDPDGDPVTVVVNAISQDEPVDAPGNGDGNTSPDGTGVGTAIASVRAERAGRGNGRVYNIHFTAMDDQGASCDGVLVVTAPHDQGGGEAIDDGQDFDSTQP